MPVAEGNLIRISIYGVTMELTLAVSTATWSHD